MAALDPPSLLEPATLLDRTRLLAAEGRLATWDRHLQSYERNTNRIRDILVSKLVALNPSTRDQPALRARIDAAKAGDDQTIRRFFQSNEIHAVHGFVEKRLGSVPIRNGKLQLTAVEMEAYQGHLDRIRQLSGQESAVRAQLARSQKAYMEKLRQAAREAAR